MIIEITKDISEAMKAKDNQKRDALRYLRSKIVQFSIDKRKEPSNDDIYQIIKTLIKQNNESLQFDIKCKEKIQNEIVYWEKYLPQTIPSEQITSEIKKIIINNQFNSIKELGKVMKILKEQYGSQVDLSTASSIATKLFTA